MRGKLESAAAAALIGDGVLLLLTPARHARRWESGPEWWQRIVRPFRRRPGLGRAAGLAELATGVAWALRIRPKRA
jgi:hypothetical protein